MGLELNPRVHPVGTQGCTCAWPNPLMKPWEGIYFNRIFRFDLGCVCWTHFGFVLALWAPFPKSSPDELKMHLEAMLFESIDADVAFMFSSAFRLCWSQRGAPDHSKTGRRLVQEGSKMPHVSDFVLGSFRGQSGVHANSDTKKAPTSTFLDFVVALPFGELKMACNTVPRAPPHLSCLKSFRGRLDAADGWPTWLRSYAY